MRILDYFCEGCENVIKTTLNLFLPCLIPVLTSKHDKYKLVKAILGFPIGLVFAIAVYYLCVRPLNINETTRVLLGLLLITTFSVSFAVSRKSRCILCLVIPSFAGPSGRAVINTLALTLLITGPIADVLLNFQDIVRVLSCTAGINHNLTKARVNLVFDPVRDVVVEFVSGAEEFKKIGREVRDAFKPVGLEVKDNSEISEIIKRTKEIDSTRNEHRVARIKRKHKLKTSDNENEKIQKQYEEKLEFRCEDIFNQAVKNCEKVFYGTEKKCYEVLPLMGALLCWPVKLTFICRIVSGFGSFAACNSDVAVNPGFGEAFNVAQNASEEFGKDFDVYVKYSKRKLTLDGRLPPVKDVQEQINAEFIHRKTFLDLGLDLVNRMMALMVIFVLLSSVNYHNNYVKDVEFDNIYISNYFERIDARRKCQNKTTLLPLKKIERKLVIYRTDPCFVRAEKRSILASVVIILSQFITVLILLIFNYLLCEVLSVLRDKGKVEFTHTGRHNVQMYVNGTGLVATMIRRLIDGIDAEKTINDYASLEVCLPNPKRTKSSILLAIILLFFFLMLLSYFQAYILRSRSKICGFFYYKWEKRRTLYLYNELQRRRKAFLRLKRHELRKKARESALAREESVSTAFRLRCPVLFSWLTWFTGKQKCLLCDTSEMTKCHLCEKCFATLCDECWKDMKKTCVVCAPVSDDDDDSGLSDSEDEMFGK